MGRTESIFAGILLLGVVLAVTMVMFRADARLPGIASGTGAAAIMVDQEGPLRFGGGETQDLCACYTQAYRYARAAHRIDGVEYKGGFSMCSQRLGANGGEAWTVGWLNGQAPSGGTASCRPFVSQVTLASR